MKVGQLGPCQQCDGQFKAHSTNQRFCSLDCRTKFNVENPEIEPKLCRKCKVRKPFSQFYFKADAGRYNHRCKACVLELDLEKRVRGPFKKRTPAQIRANTAHKLKGYGLKISDYEEMLEKQNHVCAICKRPEDPSNGKKLSVDHCHTTGEVRGLLCSKCNSGIGYLGDSLERLISAVNYLGKYDYLEDLLAERAGNQYCYDQYEIARGK